MCTTVLASARTCVLNEWEIRDWFFFFSWGQRMTLQRMRKRVIVSQMGLQRSFETREALVWVMLCHRDLGGTPS